MWYGTPPYLDVLPIEIKKKASVFLINVFLHKLPYDFAQWVLPLTTNL